jgi:hypothetical protein
MAISSKANVFMSGGAVVRVDGPAQSSLVSISRCALASEDAVYSGMHRLVKCSGTAGLSALASVHASNIPSEGESAGHLSTPLIAPTNVPIGHVRLRRMAFGRAGLFREWTTVHARLVGHKCCDRMLIE